MRKTSRRFLALALLAGCSNPETGTLPENSIATIHNPGKDSAYCVLDGGHIDMIPVGMKVRVVEDPGPGANRKVRIAFDSGRYDGRSGLVERDHLRPF